MIFSLAQDNLAEIRAAVAAGTLSVLASSRSDAAELGQGSLDLIDNQIDTATGTLRLKARFANLDNNCGRANSSTSGWFWVNAQTP